MVILDTDSLTLLEWKGTEHFRKLYARLSELPKDQIGTTIISYEEKTRGWFKVLADAKAISEQIEAYRKLHRHLDSFREIEIADFDDLAAATFQSLRKTHRRLGKADLKIAAICLAQNHLLVSRNLRDFKQIPDLRVEDWTK